MFRQSELKKIYDIDKPLYNDDFLNKEIILYGAGSLGHMACNLLKQKNIIPKLVVDKTAKGEIDGIPIISPDEIQECDKKNSLFLVCISTLSFNDLENFLRDSGIENLIQFYTYAYIKFPELLSNGWFKYSLSNDEKSSVENVCKALEHDETSIHHYMQFLWWKLAGREVIYENYPVLSGKKFFKAPSFPTLNNQEVLLDCGAHFGQTIDAFFEKINGKYKNIYAFEPDCQNLKIVREKYNDERIVFFEQALSDFEGCVQFQDGLGYASKIDKKGNKKVKVTKIDLLKDISPTIIKLHIEGNELKALYGAQETIKKNQPIIMVLADHNEDGLYKVAEFLIKLEGYKLYFNLHDYCGNTAIFYAYPHSRYK